MHGSFFLPPLAYHAGKAKMLFCTESDSLNYFGALASHAWEVKEKITD